MAGRLSGKVAIVTGAGSGIGRGIALRFGCEGAAVVLAERNHDSAFAVAEEIRTAGGEALAVPVDVSDDEAVQSLITTTERQLGGLHVLVNNAGIDISKPLEQTDESLFSAIVGVNLKGTYSCTRHAVPALVRQGGGSIINISSVQAFMGTTGSNIYAATKGAILSMTRTLAVELGPQRIRVNAICPGYIRTAIWTRFAETLPDRAQVEARLASMHPVGRQGRPEDVAAAALFFASDEATFVSGAHLVVDGAFSCKLHLPTE